MTVQGSALPRALLAQLWRSAGGPYDHSYDHPGRTSCLNGSPNRYAVLIPTFQRNTKFSQILLTNPLLTKLVKYPPLLPVKHKKLNIFISIGLVKNSSGRFVALELSFHIQSL